MDSLVHHALRGDHVCVKSLSDSPLELRWEGPQPGPVTAPSWRADTTDPLYLTKEGT